MWSRPYTYADYLDYIQNSQVWQWKRSDVFARENYCCQNCGRNNQPLHCHHTSKAYQYPLGEEPLDTLHCLCRDCHRMRHGIGEPSQISWQALADKIKKLGT